MKEEFTYRLRNRDIKEEYSELTEMKEYLCQLRLRLTKATEYRDWTMDQLKKAIAKLQNNKWASCTIFVHVPSVMVNF